VTLAQVTLVADGAMESLLVLIRIRIVAAENAVLVVVLQVWWVRTKSNPNNRWLVVWCDVIMVCCMEIYVVFGGLIVIGDLGRLESIRFDSIRFDLI